jgi:hypothetical protein
MRYFHSRLKFQEIALISLIISRGISKLSKIMRRIVLEVLPIKEIQVKLELELRGLIRQTLSLASKDKSRTSSLDRLRR